MELGHFGKEYAGEKALISLTSWKARINTVGLTIFNLLTTCPGFHIVLCLSSDEFPQKEKELPKDLITLSNSKLVEILWVKRNYKALKKVLFAMSKYQTIPIISADDDCLYTCNYAEELYQCYLKSNLKNAPITYNKVHDNPYITEGPCTLYPPKIAALFSALVLPKLDVLSSQSSADDTLFEHIFKALKIQMQFCHPHEKLPLKFHTKVGALNPSQYNNPYYTEYFA